MAEQDASADRTPEFGEHYDAVIVGAGIGGLTCGALLAKEGANVLIVERHTKPGGYVTAYHRKGYSFQVPHVMGGCGPGGDVTRVMDHLGIHQEFTRLDPYLRFIYPDHDIKVPCDMEQYADALKDAFQPQTTNVNDFFKSVRSLVRGMDMSMVRRPMGLGRIMRGLSYPFTAPKMLSYMTSGTTLQKMLDKHFSDEQIKAVISTPWPFLGSPPWDVTALAMVGMLKSFSAGAYVPVGGFQELADAFARAFTDNGGTLLLGHEVTSINMEGGRASEVEMVPRAKVSAGVVVSDADSKRTYLKLIARENFNQSFLERKDEGPVSMTGLVVHLGMRKKLPEEFAAGPIMVQPSYDMHEMLEAVSVRDNYPDPAKLSWGLMAPSMIDRSLAPLGKTSLDIIVPAVPYRFMNRWGVEPGGVRGDKYKSIKERYAEVVVEAVHRTFPGLISDVEAYDIATPITYERYTMAIDGCWYDSAQTSRQSMSRRGGLKTPVKGLYFTGAKSVLGGGIYPSIMSGVLAADTITKGAMDPLFR